MFHINKILEKINSMDGKIGRDIIIPISDARLLREELKELLEDASKKTPTEEPVITVIMKGKKW